MSLRPSAVIVGQVDDPHVEAVVDHIRADPLVIDAHSISVSKFALGDGHFTIQTRDRVLELDIDEPVRGWARRLAPPDWQRGVTLESRSAAIKSSWLSLLTSVIRTCGTQWLTSIDAQIVGEGKVLQAHVAHSVGVPAPRFVVTSDATRLKSAFGREFVLKPLGPGHYFEDGEPFVVFANRLHAEAPELAALAGAPFIAQEVVAAKEHLRVVTVNDEAWAASLKADGLPLDWRRDAAAHQSFTAVKPPESVHDGALTIAEALKLGYSSQDWVLTEAGPVLLDVNPAGQWLFLPAEVSEAVSRAIAAWLVRPVA